MVRPSLRRFGVRRVAVPLDIIIPEDRLTVKMIGNLAGRLASQRGRQERDDAPGAASPRPPGARSLRRWSGHWSDEAAAGVRVLPTPDFGRT